MAVAGRERLVAQPGGLMLGFALHLGFAECDFFVPPKNYTLQSLLAASTTVFLPLLQFDADLILFDRFSYPCFQYFRLTR